MQAHVELVDHRRPVGVFEDFLAQQLARHYRVVCPDVVGRGRSDWLRDPNYYVVPQYVADMATLIARLDAEYRQAQARAAQLPQRWPR